MGIKRCAFLLALPLFAQQKLPNIAVRDASILADADSRTYYLYARAERGDVVFYKSKDLAGWEGPSPLFQIPEGSWANPAQGARDPRVYFYRGKYYLFATLANSDKVIAKPPDSWRVNSMQGTQVFAGDSPEGPFRAVPNSANKPYTPENFVALGGAFYVEGDLAWLVYAHDWTQLVDANIEAIRLKADLSAPVEDPLYVFKASDAPWLPGERTTSREPRYYPAGGPSVYRTRNGGLVLAWSSPRNGKPALALARSVTGKIRGPWKQEASLGAGSQPTIFKAFDGRLMMLFNDGAVKLAEMEDTGDTIRKKVVKK